MERAAIAMMATMATATSTMVTPRSRGERGARCEISGLRAVSSAFQFSFIATAVAVIMLGSVEVAPIRLATRPNFQEYAY